MSRSRIALVTLTTALSVASLAGAETPSPAPSPSPIARPTLSPTTAIQLAQISLACSGSGPSDVASRKHSIKNTTGQTIAKGTRIHWTASNKGSGSVVLQKDLPKDDTVDVYEPGQTNGYTCTAGFVPGPADFVVKSVAWSGATTATVEIANVNPFTDAKASVVRVWTMKCLSTTVAAVDTPVPAIPKGGSVTVTVNGVPKANADYLMASANVNNAVPELDTNKDNNVRKSSEFGTNKSCTPQ